MLETLTRKDALESGSLYYFTGKPCKRGHISQRLVSNFNCLECDKLRADEKAVSAKKWRERNQERVTETRKRYYEENKDSIISKSKEYAQTNPERVKEKNRLYYEKNREKFIAVAKENKWWKKNPKLSNAKHARYRAAKVQATPSWSETDLIKEFYLNCPDGYHVDHIVPLKSKSVCGLHVIANLQYLTESENCSKQNKFEVRSDV